MALGSKKWAGFEIAPSPSQEKLDEHLFETDDATAPQKTST